MIFFRAAMSNCTCGGIFMNEPPEAPLSTGTTANPFFEAPLILLYAVKNLSSIDLEAFSDSSIKIFFFSFSFRNNFF